MLAIIDFKMLRNYVGVGTVRMVGGLFEWVVPDCFVGK